MNSAKIQTNKNAFRFGTHICWNAHLRQTQYTNWCNSLGMTVVKARRWYGRVLGLVSMRVMSVCKRRSVRSVNFSTSLGRTLSAYHAISAVFHSFFASFSLCLCLKPLFGISQRDIHCVCLLNGRFAIIGLLLERPFFSVIFGQPLFLVLNGNSWTSSSTEVERVIYSVLKEETNIELSGEWRNGDWWRHVILPRGVWSYVMTWSHDDSKVIPLLVIVQAPKGPSLPRRGVINHSGNDFQWRKHWA